MAGGGSAARGRLHAKGAQQLDVAAALTQESWVSPSSEAKRGEAAARGPGAGPAWGGGALWPPGPGRSGGVGPDFEAGRLLHAGRECCSRSIVLSHQEDTSLNLKTSLYHSVKGVALGLCPADGHRAAGPTPDAEPRDSLVLTLPHPRTHLRSGVSRSHRT